MGAAAALLCAPCLSAADDALGFLYMTLISPGLGVTGQVKTRGAIPALLERLT